MTILKWRNRSKNISVYIQNQGPYGSMEFDYVVRLLSHMGINVYVANEQLPILGYFFLKSHRWRSVIVGKFGNDYKAQYYNSDIENKMAAAFIKMLKVKDYTYYNNALSQVNLQKVDALFMINKLKLVKQYESSIIYFKRINIEDLYFMHDFVYGYKYRAMDELIRLYNKANLEVFHPAEFVLANGKTSLITPPIVEKHDDKLIVISGLTRLFYAYKQNINSVVVAVVEDCNEDTPTEGRYRINELRIKDSPLELQEMQKRNYQHYRFIEQALRPSYTSLI